MSTLVPCSSKANQKKKKNLIILRRHFQKTDRVSMISVPTASLTNADQNKPLATFKQILPAPPEIYSSDWSFICVGPESGVGPAVYLCGGICGGQDTMIPGLEGQVDFFLDSVSRYDLHQLPQEVQTISPCQTMKAKMFKPLLIHATHDRIYCITYGKVGNDPLKPIFQMYACKEDKWTVFENNQIGDILDRCNPLTRLCRIHSLSYVVIGRKIHLSLGHSSFTFDTVKHTWKTCKLFKTFWSQQEKKNTGLSPSNFYGFNVWDWSLDRATNKRKRNNLVGGPPFGFYGRGVVWKNILLGVHYAKHCPLVAFLLDRKGRVVRSQRLTLNNLDLDHGRLKALARIVKLGRDGCFSLLHTRFDRDHQDIVVDDECDVWDLSKLKMEQVTFRVEKIAVDDDDDGEDFLKYEILRKDVVEEGLTGVNCHYDAFCV